MRQLLEVTGTKLYRGTGLTKGEIQKYKNLIGQRTGKFNHDNMMAMTGFISTSIDRNIAEGFAWENLIDGKEKTLFEIFWKNRFGYYVMDMSSFPHE